MSLSLALSAFSCMQLPALSHAAAAGTVSSLFWFLSSCVYLTSDHNTFIEYASKNFAKLAICSTTVTGFVTTLTLTQKKWYVLSQAGFILGILPMLKASVTFMQSSGDEQDESLMHHLFITALAVNVVATSTLLYCGRS
jgi:hypothetical protein